MISGRVIRRMVCARLAPRISELSVRVGLSCDTTATVVRKTSGAKITVWPRTTSEKDGEMPIFEKYISAAMP